MLDDKTFPVDWDAHPAGAGSAAYGGQWLRAAKEAVLVVRSVIVPEENNVLLNPRHPEFSGVRAVNRGQTSYDHRFFAPVP